MTQNTRNALSYNSEGQRFTLDFDEPKSSGKNGFFIQFGEAAHVLCSVTFSVTKDSSVAFEFPSDFHGLSHSFTYKNFYDYMEPAILSRTFSPAQDS